MIDHEGNTVAGAHVMVQNGSGGGMSKRDGSFEITGVKQGQVRLAANLTRTEDLPGGGGRVVPIRMGVVEIEVPSGEVVEGVVIRLPAE